MSFQLVKTEKYRSDNSIPPLTLEITIEDSLYNEFHRHVDNHMFGTITIPDTYANFRRIKFNFYTDDEEYIFTSDSDIDRLLIVPAFNAKKFYIKVINKDTKDRFEFTISTEHDLLIHHGEFKYTDPSANAAGD